MVGQPRILPHNDEKMSFLKVSVGWGRGQAVPWDLCTAQPQTFQETRGVGELFSGRAVGSSGRAPGLQRCPEESSGGCESRWVKEIALATADRHGPCLPKPAPTNNAKHGKLKLK